jgi:hypothetical protein
MCPRSDERQLAALPDGAVLEIHVSSPFGAAAIRQLLAGNRIFDATVVYTRKLLSGIGFS